MTQHRANELDRHAYTDSMIHALDPRAKVVATFVYVVTVVSFGKYEVAALVPFALVPMGLSLLGFVPARLIISRLLIAAPFIVFIGIFNPLLDREALFYLDGVKISGGWVSFVSILLRGILCVWGAITLIATNSMPRIAQALGALKVPRALVVQLMLLYRYLFLLMDEAGRMNRARALRAGSQKTPLSVAGPMLSAILLRTFDRSDAIWRAMQARGFEGELHTPRTMAWLGADSIFLALVVSSCAVMRMLPITHWLGERLA